MTTSSPGFRRCHEGVEKDLLAAGADDRLLPGIVEAVLALELGGDRLAQLGNAGNRGILRFAAVDRVDGGRLDIIRRIEIRLTRAEADDVTSFAFSSRAFWETAMVAEGFTRERASARKAMITVLMVETGRKPGPEFCG